MPDMVALTNNYGKSSISEKLCVRGTAEIKARILPAPLTFFKPACG